VNDFRPTRKLSGCYPVTLFDTQVAKSCPVVYCCLAHAGVVWYSNISVDSRLTSTYRSPRQCLKTEAISSLQAFPFIHHRRYVSASASTRPNSIHFSATEARRHGVGHSCNTCVAKSEHGDHIPGRERVALPRWASRSFSQRLCGHVHRNASLLRSLKRMAQSYNDLQPQLAHVRGLGNRSSVH